MAITERGVGCGDLPVLIINTDGYYDGVITQLTRAWDEGMLRKHWTEYVEVVETPAAAVEWCLKQRRRPHESPEGSTAGRMHADGYRKGLLHGLLGVTTTALLLLAVCRR